MNREVRLFGFDLSRISAYFGLGWRQLLYDQKSWLRQRFYPSILLWHEANWWEVSPRSGAFQLNSDHAPRFTSGTPVAVSLGEDQVLLRRLRLPESLESSAKAAVEFEVAASTPFPSEDTVFGWRIAERQEGEIILSIAIAGRGSAEAALDSWYREYSKAPGWPTELWVVEDGPGRGHIELEGFTDDLRKQQYLSKLRSISLLFAFYCAATLAALMLPAAASSFRARSVTSEYNGVREVASTIELSQRELAIRGEQLAELRRAVSQRADQSAWLNHLADITPDGTYLELLQLRDGLVEIRGYSDNAANYLRLLTEQQGFTEVSATSAFVRDQRSGLERFSIKWGLQR